MRRIFFVILMLAAVIYNVDARKIKGSVKCDSESLEDVIVTDGYNFTTTRANGTFSFEIDDSAEFVYIVTPSGYVADWSSGVPAFYQRISDKKRYDFNLQRMSGGKDYHIIAVSDPQTHSDSQFEEFAAAPLADMTQTAKALKGDVIGLVLGDISWDRIEVLDMYKERIVDVGVPFYPVVGNHDNEAYVEGDKEASATYRKKMGPENYAFYVGNEVVIVLDNIIYNTGFKCGVGYTDDIIRWVRGLLQLLPSDIGLYVARHAPIGHEGSDTVNEPELLAMLEGHKVNFLAGHTHVNRNRQISEDIYEHNVAAMCGAWWDTAHCIDGTPRGYKVLSMTDGQLSWYYKPVGYDRGHIAEIVLQDASDAHPQRILANVWDWDPLWKVTWYEDGTYMGEMLQVSETSPIYESEIKAVYDALGKKIPNWKRARKSNHNFAATPSSSAKTVTISIESRFGEKFTRTITLRD